MCIALVGGITAAEIGAGAAVASVGVSAYDASVSSGIASTQENIANTTFGEQQGYASQLQQLIANPSSVTSLPGYQFQFDQGSQAVARQMSAAGFGGSTNEANALTQFGQGLASSFYGQQTQLLASLSGLQTAASTAQSGAAASSAASASSSQLNQLLGSLGVLGGLAAGNYGSSGTPAAGGGFSGPQWASGNGGQTTPTGLTLA